LSKEFLDDNLYYYPYGVLTSGSFKEVIDSETSLVEG